MLAYIKKILGIQKSMPFEFCKRWLIKKSAHLIQSGPFKGLPQHDLHIGSPYIPRLLGMYEQELHPCIENIIQSSFDHIIDVGAAEGYYALGLAHRSPQSSISAFESDPHGRSLLCDQVTKSQLTDRITILGHCDLENLNQCINPHKKNLVIMDIEGGEADLLNPHHLPNLASCSILVELHDHHRDGTSQLIRSRFEATHHIEQIFSTDRSLEDIPFKLPWWMSSFFKKWLLMLISDSRGSKMSWYWMQPKNLNPLR